MQEVRATMEGRPYAIRKDSSGPTNGRPWKVAPTRFARTPESSESPISSEEVRATIKVAPTRSTRRPSRYIGINFGRPYAIYVLTGVSVYFL